MGDVKHTPGPWTVTELALSDGEMQTRITFDEGRSLAVVDRWANWRANAQRIVACVNACEGLNPEAVPELLAAIERVLGLGELDMCDESTIGDDPHHPVTQARTALVKLFRKDSA